MSERGKSILLVTLVLLSFLLTYQLWFGQRPLEEITEDAYEPIHFEEPRPLTRVIAPRWVMMRQGEEIFLFRYGSLIYKALWNRASDLLQELEFDGYKPREEKSGNGFPWITFSFAPALPTGHGTPWLKDAVQRDLDQVIMMKEGEHYWLELRVAGGTVISLDISPKEGLILQELVESLSLEDAAFYRELDEDELREALGVEILLAEPLYVPAGRVQLEELIYTEEELDRELLVKTFFVNRNLVRVIAERDGTLIYTDGEKGLRLNGGLAFSHPQVEQARTANTYLTNLNFASRLLSFYGGWPEYLRLESLERRAPTGGLQKSLFAGWRAYYRGRPIFGDTGAVMIFNDGGMVEYRRKLYEAVYPTGSPSAVRDYREALISALAVLSDKASPGEVGSPLILEDLVLGYAPDIASGRSRIVPAWLIRINGADLLIHAKNLSRLEGVAQ